MTGEPELSPILLLNKILSEEVSTRQNTKSNQPQ
jgi:hypothetical protein